MTIEKKTNRREFLAGAGNAALGGGLVLSLPAITLRRALGADVPPPSERIRIGIIGTGRQGSGNMGHVLKNIVAVCDVDAQHLAAAKARVEKANGGACAAYTDYRKLLDDKTIDAVVISTPDHWHALTSADACAAGKDVYCEKPLTHNVAEGRALVKVVRDHNRIFQTGSMQRSDARFRHACELVRSGRIGKVHTVLVGIPGANFTQAAVPDSAPPPELDYDLWLGPAPQRPYNVNHVHYYFRFYWDYAGGQMTNWGAHHIDIAHWGLGMDDGGPLWVQGTGKYDPTMRFETPQSFDVTYGYPGDVTLSVNQKNRGGVTFQGDKGSIWVTRGKTDSTPPEILLTPLTDADTHLYVSNSHFGNWLDCIKTRKLPICDVEIGHRSATACHLGNIAIRTSRRITWDAAKEQIVGDDDASKLLSRVYRAPWALPVA